MSQTLKLICPVALELGRDAEGGVVIGPGTQRACDLAVSIANEDPAHSIVITAAGYAGDEWDRAWTGGLMGKYIKARTSARVLRQMAKTFDIFGEMSILAYTVHHMWRRGKCFSEIVLTVKPWHARRAEFICRRLLKKLNLQHIPVSTRSYERPVGWRGWAREHMGAWLKNLVRLMFTRGDWD